MAQKKKRSKGWFDTPGRCPACAQIFRVATYIESGKVVPPVRGDVTICTRCGEILLFGDKGSVRRPTVAEMIEIQRLPSGPMVERASRSIREFKPFHKSQGYASKG